MRDGKVDWGVDEIERAVALAGMVSWGLVSSHKVTDEVGGNVPLGRMPSAVVEESCKGVTGTVELVLSGLMEGVLFLESLCMGRCKADVCEKIVVAVIVDTVE